MKIRKAVIPVAGLGTRFLPATKVQPKEMLPVVTKPVIQYVIEECHAAGITQILLITGKHKRAIEDYLDRADPAIQSPVLEEFDRILDDLHIHYIRQREPAGLGDAVGYARTFAAGDPFALLLGDNITLPNCTLELKDVFERYDSPIIAIEEVDAEKVRNHGIVAGTEVEKGTFRIDNLVEKPAESSSRLAIIGRYILDAGIFDHLDRTGKGAGGEIQLTDALGDMVREGNELYAVLHRGRRYDLGNHLDWLRANIELGLEDAELGPALEQWMRRCCGRL